MTSQTDALMASKGAKPPAWSKHDTKWVLSLFGTAVSTGTGSGPLIGFQKALFHAYPQ